MSTTTRPPREDTRSAAPTTRQHRRAWLRPRTILIAVFGVFLAIQLVPIWLWQTNPPVKAEPPWDSPQTRELARRACYDCHSNETVWPIYSRIAPMSWLVTYDVLKGRGKLNFSEWGQATAGAAGEAGEAGEGGEAGEVANEAGDEIREGKMPPSNYLLLHPAARLTEAEKQQLIQGLQLSLR